MSATHFGFEIPGMGAVIVGDAVKTGQLFYDGRAQGGQFIADNDAGLRIIAHRRKQKLRRDLGPEFDRLYPADIWELRIWD
jgi:hypothetical protein